MVDVQYKTMTRNPLSADWKRSASDLKFTLPEGELPSAQVRLVAALPRILGPGSSIWHSVLRRLVLPGGGRKIANFRDYAIQKTPVWPGPKEVFDQVWLPLWNILEAR